MNHRRTRIKICGLTRREDALEACAAGADALGFIHYPASPRHVELLDADWIGMLPPLISRVAVVVNPDLEFLAKLASVSYFDCVQFHGHESPQTINIARQLGFRVVKALRPSADSEWASIYSYPFDTILLDTPAPDGRLGGTGLTGDWDRVAQLVRDLKDKRVILSGGLSAINVGGAVRKIRPYAVDVSSGVEVSPGIKNHVALHAFCEAVFGADNSV